MCETGTISFSWTGIFSKFQGFSQLVPENGWLVFSVRKVTGTPAGLPEVAAQVPVLTCLLVPGCSRTPHVRKATNVTRTRRFPTVIASLFALLAMAGGLLFSTASGNVAAQNEASAGASPQASPAAEVAYTFTVDAEQSTARYRAQEELSGIGANEAVGETNAIIGTLLFDANYQPVAGSRIDVDLRTLKSDETRRDNFLYDNVLETGQFPLATFIVTGVEGLEGGLPDGEEVTFKLTGDLTLHGVTNAATWDVTVTRDGDALTGSATTTFVLADYDMEKPIIGPVVSIDDDIVLEIDVTAMLVEA